jgi:hypothetical protein
MRVQEWYYNSITMVLLHMLALPGGSRSGYHNSITLAVSTPMSQHKNCRTAVAVDDTFCAVNQSERYVNLQLQFRSFRFYNIALSLFWQSSFL